MTFVPFAFYCFSATLLGSAVAVVLSRNPVHAVLWLILAFFASAGLFVLLGAEFLAMLLAIVYVGAVAVLFLFVVMMLDVDFSKLRAGVAQHAPLGILIGLVLIVQLGLIYAAWTQSAQAVDLRQNVTPIDLTNTEALGAILYDQYIYAFQAAGLILLVAMIGAIVLTMRHRPDLKRQNPNQQMYRDPAQSMELRDVKPGQGL